MSTCAELSPSSTADQQRAQRLVEEVASRIGMPVPTVALWDKRGAAARPWRGEVYLSHDVLQRPAEQTRAVIVHELAHLYHRDTVAPHLISLVLGLVATVLLYAGVVPSQVDELVALWVAGLILLTARRCRRVEARADRFAARAGYGPALRAYLKHDHDRARPWLWRAVLWLGRPAATHPTHRARLRSIRAGELMTPLRLPSQRRSRGWRSGAGIQPIPGPLGERQAFGHVVG